MNSTCYSIEVRPKIPTQLERLSELANADMEEILGTILSETGYREQLSETATADATRQKKIPRVFITVKGV